MAEFVQGARVETMLRDIGRLRRAIRTDHDIEAAEEALDKCERWFDQLKVISQHDAYISDHPPEASRHE